MAAYLNGLAGRYLAERESEIARLRTRNDLEQRKRAVREKILRLIL